MLDNRTLYIHNDDLTIATKLVDDYMVVYGMLGNEPQRKILKYAKLVFRLFVSADEVVILGDCNIGGYFGAIDKLDYMTLEILNNDLEQIVKDARVIGGLDNLLNVKRNELQALLDKTLENEL